MSDYKVLAEVGQSLVNLLWENIQADTDLVALINSANLISLESPAEHQENSDSALLSVYLYRIPPTVLHSPGFRSAVRGALSVIGSKSLGVSLWCASAANRSAGASSLIDAMRPHRHCSRRNPA